LGRARLARFLCHSRGAFGEAMADRLLAAAVASLQRCDDELSFPDLVEDIAVEARLALRLTEEFKESTRSIPGASSPRPRTGPSAPPRSSATFGFNRLGT
jgi:hypothetical protein